MFVLLDTHALIWLDQDDPSLGAEARKRADLALQQGRLAVSAISFWETGNSEGYQIKGRATIQTEGKIYEETVEWIRNFSEKRRKMENVPIPPKDAPPPIQFPILTFQDRDAG